MIRIVLLLCLLYAGNCSRQHNIPRAQNDSGEVPLQEFTGKTKLIMSDSGKTEWVLNTMHMVKKSTEGTSVARPVDFYYYNGNDAPLSHLTAEYGETMGRNFENFLVKGKVRVDATKGYKLRAEDLKWDRRISKITSAGRVYFTTLQGDVLTGIGFESDPDLENWKILKNVRGVFQKFEKRMDKGEF